MGGKICYIFAMQLNPEIEKWVEESDPDAIEYMKTELLALPDARDTHRDLKDFLEQSKRNVKKLERYWRRGKEAGTKDNSGTNSFSSRKCSAKNIFRK